MPNPIKYSTSAQTLSLKEGNFWIGTNDVSKGETLTSGYWNGITPPVGGYTIYLNKGGTQGPSIYVAANDSDLIFLTNRIAGSSYTKLYDCLNWFSTQNDKVVFNIDYPKIPTNGITFISDIGTTLSYPKGGFTSYSMDPTTNGGYVTYINGAYGVSEYGGGIRFDGVDDSAYTTVSSGGFGTYNTKQFTWVMIARSNNSASPNTWSATGGLGSNRYPGNGWQLTNLVGTRQVDFYMGDTSQSWATLIGSITPTNIDVPHMYVISSNGANVHKGYVDNGSPISNGTNLTRTASQQNELIWGRDGYIGGTETKLITYVQIMYDRQLSDNEVLQLYDAYRPRFGF
jgi:hypothetical protein